MKRIRSFYVYLEEKIVRESFKTLLFSVFGYNNTGIHKRNVNYIRIYFAARLDYITLLKLANFIFRTTREGCSHSDCTEKHTMEGSVNKDQASVLRNVEFENGISLM